MPEYLAPGVYVEETSFRAKSIEGVGTSTTAFVGPTRKGPFRAGDDTPETPELLTSYGDFERIYGGFADLALGAGVAGDELSRPRGARFFNEGGSRLYVSRVVGAGRGIRGRAPSAAARADEQVQFVARFPGAVGNGGVIVREVRGARLGQRRWRRRRPARCCAPGPAAALVHHVKVGTDWRPADNLAGPAADPATLAGSQRPRFSRC